MFLSGQNMSRLNDVLKTFVKKVPITEVLSYFGVTIYKDNKILCPFHNEDFPSAHIYTDTNKVFCFGKCRSHYDVIDIVRHFEGCDFGEAIDFLRRNFTNKVEMKEKKIDIELYKKINNDVRGILVNNKVDVREFSKLCQLLDMHADDKIVLMKVYGTILKKYRN